MSQRRPFQDRSPHFAEFWYRYAPELRLCRTPFEFREATMRKGDGIPLRSLAIPFLFCAAAIYMFKRTLPGLILPVAVSPLAEPLGYGAIAVMLVGWVSLVARDQFRRRVRGFLLSRGVPLCLRCGYDLRGINARADPRCPECGGATPTPPTSAPR